MFLAPRSYSSVFYLLLSSLAAQFSLAARIPTAWLADESRTLSCDVGLALAIVVKLCLGQMKLACLCPASLPQTLMPKLYHSAQFY